MSFVLSLLILGEAALLLPDQAYEPHVSEGTQAVMQQAEELGPRQLVARLEALSASGDDTAAEFLGEIFGLGALGVERDPRRACDIFESIAAIRPDAAHNFATCFYTGSGRDLDHISARQWYRKAAEGGWTMARCAFGNMLLRGEGGEPEPETGYALCLSAAQMGNINAQADVGTYLIHGKGVARDAVEARIWLDRAATRGQANAAFLLAQIFQKGDGTPPSETKAAEWYEKAHAAGRKDAAYQAALSYVRQGFRRTGDKADVSPGLLRKAVNWAETASKEDPDPELRKRAADLIPGLETLIEKGRKPAD